MLELDKIALKDGKLFQCVCGVPLNPVLDVPPISITGKLGSTRVSETEFAFKFSLSHHTCPEWRDIFSKNLDASRVSFSGDEMALTCTPDSLPRLYNEVKAAIPSTNTTYSEKRDWVTKEIQKRNQLVTKRQEQRREEDSDAQSALQSLNL